MLNLITMVAILIVTVWVNPYNSKIVMYGQAAESISNLQLSTELTTKLHNIDMKIIINTIMFLHQEVTFEVFLVKY